MVATVGTHDPHKLADDLSSDDFRPTLPKVDLYLRYITTLRYLTYSTEGPLSLTTLGDLSKPPSDPEDWHARGYPCPHPHPHPHLRHRLGTHDMVDPFFSNLQVH